MTWTTLPRSDLGHGLAGWRGGTGPQVLLVHGVGLNADAWQPMLTGLTTVFSVTAVDLPGHGASAALHEAAPRLADYTDAVGHVMADIDGEVIVIGHSLGALIAMTLAASHAEKINGAVALNAIYRRSDTAAHAVRQRAAELAGGDRPSNVTTLRRWFDDAQSEVRDQCAAMLSSCDMRAYAAAYHVFANSEAPSDDALRATTIPMLFITGEQEPNSTPAMSHALAETVPFGFSEIVADAKHMMPMTHADEVNALTKQFVRGIGVLTDA